MTYPPPEQQSLPVPHLDPPLRSRRPPHPRAILESFTWTDLAAVVVYVAVMIFSVPLLVLVMFPGGVEWIRETPSAGFWLNFVSYAICAVMVLIALKKEFWASFKTFLWYPLVKYLCVPGSWFATTLIAGLLVQLFAGLQGVSPTQIDPSENQQAANSMMETVPFVSMAMMVVLMGPLVEEYLFRHLLIGKLSALLQRRLPAVARVLNPWVLMVVAALAFTYLHFIGAGEAPTVFTATPYLFMGLAFGTGYLLAGRSVAYSYCLHAFSNLVAISLSYLVAGA